MRSKAHIKGHPLHPILVAFPIAFFVGTLLLDIFSAATDRPDLQQVAFYLEAGGIVFGLLAAVPGFIDFLFTVPPKSSAKKRAGTHGLINVSMVVVFSIAWIIRQDDDVSFSIVLLLEVVGVVLLSIAGWMGGTLVYRNQIGVDIRYADAGKWNESRIDKGSGKIEVASADELKVNQMKLVHIGDRRIVLSRTEKAYAAFDDRCTHRGGSLAAGAMICGTVQCPWHGSHFDVATGEVKAGPAKQKIKTYQVSQSNGKIFVAI